MTPQSPFMVVAEIADGHEADLRALLATMNAAPGIADAHNALLPFGDFTRLHFARWVILDDATTVDFSVLGLPVPHYPLQLAFMGDCDGPAELTLADMARRAEGGLRKIFAHCKDFNDGTDLYAWLRENNIPVAANYVNWIGRRVVQIKQEAALQNFLAARVPRAGPRSVAEAQQARRELIAAVDGEVRAGRLALTRKRHCPPLRWSIANLIHAVGIPTLFLLLSPLLLVAAPFVIWHLRRLEKSDAEICAHPDPQSLQALRQLEDRDVTNQFSALGSLKPGLFRRWLATVILVGINYASRHVFNRGHLGRVRTIHFARWVFIDDKRRIVFCSNYDGSHEAYMDDFINKVAWGLNLIFSNGIGWPRTDWLICRGARLEQRFKYYQRRHQIPSQVWYKAYPGLTALDMIRNQRIRDGLEQASMSDAEVLAWVRLL